MRVEGEEVVMMKLLDEKVEVEVGVLEMEEVGEVEEVDVVVGVEATGGGRDEAIACEFQVGFAMQ